MKAIYNFFHHFYHRRYHGIYRHAKKLFVLDLCLMALSIIILGVGIFFFYWSPSISGQIDLEVSFGGNRIKSGEPVNIVINYANNSKYLLKNSVLSLHLPKGFLTNHSITPDYFFKNNESVDLKNIKPGASGQVEISGWLYSPIKTEEKIIALLSYEPEGLNFKDQKTSAFIVNLPESIFTTKTEVAESAFPSSQLPLIYKIKNNSKETADNLSLQTEFTGTISFPKEAEKFSLKAGETKSFPASITMPNVGGDIILNITVAASINKHLIKIQTDAIKIKSISPSLQSRLELLNYISYAEPNQTIPIKISWKNAGANAIKNIRLKIMTTPGIVDIAATAKDNNIKYEGADLIIDSTKRTSLSGNSFFADSYVINLRLLPHFSLEQNNTILEIYPILEANIPAVADQKFSIKGEGVNIKLATSLNLNAQARYYTAEGDQLGRGPLPPKVGETTKYWIFATMNNSINPTRNNKITITLAPGVQFTGKQSVTIGPALTYNENTNTLNWNFYRLPTQSQTGLYFEVAITPNPEQIGKKIKLVDNLQFSAIDNATGKTFNLLAGPIYNNLMADDLGNTKVAEVEN